MVRIGLIWITLAVISTGCGQGTGNRIDPEGRGKALVITSDYQDGSYTLIDLVDRSAQTNVVRIHPDAVCRYDPITKTPFIVSRMNADAVEVLDPEDGWQVVGEYSVGPGSNPQDIAVVSEERAFVVRYGEPVQLIVHPTEGTELGTVDIGAYADADGVPEATWSLVHAGQVFVTLQRLADFQPTDHSSLLIIDGASGEVEREIRLDVPNPFAPLRYVPAMDRISVPEAGTFGQLDGGLELLAPDAQGPAGLAVTEQDLGGDLVDAVVVDEARGYAVIGLTHPDGEMTTALVSFDPITGQVLATLEEAEGWDHSLLALSPDRTELWVTDRRRTAPGVRIYSVTDDQELTDGPIDTGLPPIMVCFVP